MNLFSEKDRAHLSVAKQVDAPGVTAIGRAFGGCRRAIIQDTLKAPDDQLRRIYMFRFINVMTAVLIVVLAVCIPIANASTIVFGEDGANQDLTGSSAGSSWSSSDEFIIAGDCYVPDDSTLTIGSGVTVKFDYDYGGDNTGYPEIQVKGILKCNGTSSNHVTFTNDSDTTRGLFKGLHLMGDSTSTYNYEGKMEGTYVDFYYGGADSGLVTVGERAILDLNHCIIRRSGFHGIYIYEEGSKVVLDTCHIDSSLESGISWSFNENHNCILQVDGCMFEDNQGGDIVMPQPPPDPEPMPFVRGSTFICYGLENRWGAAIILPADGEEREFGIVGSILNNYFVGQRFGGNPDNQNIPNKIGILIFDGTVTADQELFEIGNNVFAGVSIGIYIEGLDFERQEGQETWILSLRVHNNVFWACEESGLFFEFYSHEAGPDWPEDNIILEYNLFGAGIGDFDIEFNENQVDDPIVPENNAFKNDDRLSNCVYDDDCRIDELGDDWNLVNEVGNWPGGAHRPDFDSYDFHILKDSGVNTLLNWGPVNSRQDPDDSPADIGCYGGPYANRGIGEEGSHPGGVNVNNHQYDQPFYVKLMGGNWQANSLIWNNVYYLYQDFTVPVNFTYTMSAGAWIITKDDGIDFFVNGTLDADGTEADPIRFADGTDADGFGGDTWEGIQFTTTATTDCLLDYVEICGTDNNSSGIHIDNVDGAAHMTISNCHVYQNGDYGIWIEDNSEVDIVGCQVNNNGSDGIYIDDSVAGEITIDNVNVHHNGESGIRLHDAIPDIDNLDGNSVSRFNLNTLYGMELDGSDPDLNDYPDHGNTEFEDNTDSAVWLTIDSSPTVINGYNDFEPNGQLAIEYAADPDPGILGAWRNWWGTDSPTDALFNYPDNVSYEFYPNDQGNVDNLSAFEIAKRAFDSGDYEESIALFERAVFDRDNYTERFAALRYLKGAYKHAGMDFEDLRTFYTRAANRIEEPRIAFEAGRQNALTLKLTGEYEDLIDLLTARRRILENRADSIRNEMDLFKVVNLLERRNNRLNGIDSDTDYRAEYDKLMDMWNDALDNGNENTEILPHSVDITSVYPNPFNNSTTIRYSLKEDLKAEVAIYNACGQQVDVLHSGHQKAGNYSLNWNADGVSSGVYFIRLSTPETTVTRKTLLIQ